MRKRKQRTILVRTKAPILVYYLNDKNHMVAKGKFSQGKTIRLHLPAETYDSNMFYRVDTSHGKMYVAAIKTNFMPISNMDSLKVGLLGSVKAYEGRAFLKNELLDKKAKQVVKETANPDLDMYFDNAFSYDDGFVKNDYNDQYKDKDAFGTWETLYTGTSSGSYMSDDAKDEHKCKCGGKCKECQERIEKAVNEAKNTSNDCGCGGH